MEMLCVRNLESIYFCSCLLTYFYAFFYLVWDMRVGNAYASLKISEDSISSMITNREKRILACTATDGSLIAVKIRGGSIQTESEVYESEFNCIGLFKQESKLAIGNGQGLIGLLIKI